MQKIIRVYGFGVNDNSITELNKLLSTGWRVISSNLVQSYDKMNTYDYLIEKQSGAGQ